MNNLEELEYYCRKNQPTGALMLSGEWGSGKTYYLKNILPKSLGNEYVLLYISLFGFDSVEEIKKEVKRCWFQKEAELKLPSSILNENVGRIIDITKKIAEKPGVLPKKVKTIFSTFLSIDFVDFVKIKPNMDARKVIIIFDDLERSNLNTIELLGCINDYCENLLINTIIVANEEKIISYENNKINYDIIKEKIVQRTIKYSPDYKEVIANIINNMFCDKKYEDYKEYSNFLNENRDKIISLFSNPLYNKDANEPSPQNLRSLKCSLHDFERIYELLLKKEISNKEKFLYSFISYVLCARANILDDEKISSMYSGFYNDYYVTSGIRNWVSKGVWEEEKILKELDYFQKRYKAHTPEEKVRMNHISNLEDNDFNVGCPKVVIKAYNGELGLNEYMLLLHNCRWARDYNIDFPKIDWDKFCDGIDKKVDKIVKHNESDSSCNLCFSSKFKTSVKGESKAFEMLKNYLETDILISKRNREYYLDNIKNNPLDTLSKIGNSRIDIFNEQMSKETIEGFKALTNRDKNIFINQFYSLWDVNINYFKSYFDNSYIGLFDLDKNLLELADDYKTQKSYIAAAVTNEFSKKVKKLSKDLETKNV